MPAPLLFLTQVLPYPLDAGPKVRAYHTLRWLAERAEVHLVSFARADDPPAAVAHLRSFCASVHTVPMARSRARDAYHLARALATGASFIVARDGVAAMRRLLGGLVGTRAFAAVHADQLWMAQYARGLPVGFKVLDDHNAVYRVFERLAAREPSWPRRALLRREARRLARYELAQVAAFDRTVFVSEEDRRAMRAVAADGDLRRLEERTAVIPICVDAAAITPILPRPDARRVTVLGTMHWPPNAEGVLWFAEHVLPRVRRAVPDAVLTVVGKNPPPAVVGLARRYPGAVEVTGYVPDPTPHLAETAAFAVPLLSGGGMRVKILDAWAWGLPVVTTTVGAEGIDVRAGADALVSDTPEGFADGCQSLLTNPDLRRRLGEAGRAAVAERYDARRVYGALAEVYGGVLG